MHTDKMLLLQCQSGDTVAYGQLFKRYFKRVYGFAFSLLKDQETARELAMDVFLRLWQHRLKIEIEDNLAPFLFRSIKNAVYNHLRKKKIFTHSIYDLEEDLLSLSPAADEQLAYKELYSLYQQKLQGLPEQRRKIFQLSREQHLSYAEIANEMNLSVNTVRNQMSASIAYFRKHLGTHREALTVILLISYATTY